MLRSSSYRPQCHRGAHNALDEQEEQEAPFFGKADKQTSLENNHSPFFQTKLNIGQPNDRYEKEADSVADKVVNNNASTASVVQKKEISGIQRLATSKEEEKQGTNDARMLRDKEIQEKPEVQRKCDSCEQEEKDGAVQKKDGPDKKEEEEVQKKSESGGSSTTASKGLSNKIQSSSGKGHSLSPGVMGEMSSSFNADFSQVKIHTDAESVGMNKELGAQAFTHGNDIYFNNGKYDPGTSTGKHLLAHELTHVVQQGAAGETVQRKMDDGHDLQAVRFKGDSKLEAAFDDEGFVRKGASGNHIYRLQAALRDLGYTLPQFGVDGQFGSETERAMQAFQSDHALAPDAIVGPKTMGTLDNIYADAGLPACPLNKGNAEAFDGDGTGTSGEKEFPIPCQSGGQPGVTSTCGCQNPPTNDDCSKKTTAKGKNKMDIIMDAVKEAAGWLPGAQSKMSDYISATGNATAAAAMNAHFSWNDTTKKSTLQNVPAIVKKVIDNTLTNIAKPFCGNCQETCPAIGKDVFATSPGAWKNSNCYEFCEPFFGANKTLQAKIILHEMMHSWEGKSDIAYEVDTTGYPPPVNTSPGNADSYASLIRDLK